MIITPDAPPSIRLSGQDWRLRWALGIAEAVAAAADCTRRRVGAVVLDPSSWMVLGTGYNGLRAGRDGCLTAAACPRGRRSYKEVPGLVTPYGAGGIGSCEALHGEQNAVERAVEAGHRLEGMVIAITDEPCTGCRVLLARHRLALAVWPDGRWDVSDEIPGFAKVTRPATRGREA